MAGLALIHFRVFAQGVLMVHTNVKRTTWLLTLVLTLILSAAPLSAFANQLVMTTPAQNSVLTIAPNQVTVTSAGSLQDMGNQLSVTAPDGSRVDDGSITVVDKSLTVGLKPLTMGGTYRVDYEFISINDSHFKVLLLSFLTPLQSLLVQVQHLLLAKNHNQLHQVELLIILLLAC